MPTSPIVYQLVCCGPGDVSREIEIARRVAEEWNLAHNNDATQFVKFGHWSTDATPDLSERPQSVINGQLIDKADILVAIFWSRFGTPTGIAKSGTEEEVRRALKKKKRVMLYFSDLESPRLPIDQEQYQKVQSFRHEMRDKGLYWTFKSRAEFEKLFTRHLARVLEEIREGTTKAKKAPTKKPSGVNQKGTVNINLQGDKNKVSTNIYQKPPAVKVLPPPGSVTPAEQKQIHEWIDELVANTVDMSVGAAKGQWWSRLCNHCSVKKFELILSSQMRDVEQWFKINRSILKQGLKKKAPDQWRANTRGAIKAAMKKMGRTSEDYYPELSRRLKMKKPFGSITELTDVNLKRVYQMVLKDAR